MYLAIDQHGQKTIIPDYKRKTLKEKFFCGQIKKMYIDNTKTGKSRHCGFVLGQGKGNISLWISIFKCTPINLISIKEEV